MNYEKRVCILYCTMLLFATILITRLYNLSKPETNKSISVLDGQYTGRIEVCERSGFVYDRNGFIISHNLVGKTALVNPAECTDTLFYAEKLSQYALVSTASDIYENLMDGSPFTISVRHDFPSETINGVYTFDVYEDNFDLANHFLGYNNSDGKGMSGLRRAYDTLLSGELFSTVSASFETDAKRTSLSPFNMETEKYLSFDGIVTTLDRDIQSLCDGFGDKIKSGAIVVAEVESGKILALSSFPSYDAKNIAAILNSDKGELLNRACESFSPGSVFKMAVAATALERDETLFDYEYECTGKTEIDGAVFRCHKHTGHGKITMKEAFANSCNTYFINMGKMLGAESIIDTMKLLELDRPTSADFLGETKNHFPDGDPDSLRYLANISFGQGDLCLSPLDMIRMTIASATGNLVGLSAIEGEIREGVLIKNEKDNNKRIFCENTCKKMREMMKCCILEGTGIGAKIYGANTGGKTATAQTGRFSKDGVEYVHKWFCGVYPIENPRIAICVLCDNEIDENVSPSVIFGEICSFLLENDV